MNKEIRKALKTDHKRLMKELRALEGLMKRAGIVAKAKRRKKRAVRAKKAVTAAPKVFVEKNAKTGGNGTTTKAKSKAKSKAKQMPLFPSAPVISTKAQRAAELRAQQLDN